MNSNLVEYKGYYSHINYDAKTKELHEKIEDINDYVDFIATDVLDVENEFHQAVEDYLSFCRETGKEPEKPYKGNFNIRIPKDVHRKLVFEAKARDMNLNQLVSEILTVHVFSANS